MKVAWFVALFSAICLEGLGRKYLPAIPAVAFYFLKDVILVAGYVWFRAAAGRPIDQQVPLSRIRVRLDRRVRLDLAGDVQSRAHVVPTGAARHPSVLAVVDGTADHRGRADESAAQATSGLRARRHGRRDCGVRRGPVRIARRCCSQSVYSSRWGGDLRRRRRHRREHRSRARRFDVQLSQRVRRFHGPDSGLAPVDRAGGEGSAPASLCPARDLGHGGRRADGRLAWIRHRGGAGPGHRDVVGGAVLHPDRPADPAGRDRGGVLVRVRVPRRDERRPEPFREHRRDRRPIRRARDVLAARGALDAGLPDDRRRHRDAAKCPRLHGRLFDEMGGGRRGPTSSDRAWSDRIPAGLVRQAWLDDRAVSRVSDPEEGRAAGGRRGRAFLHRADDDGEPRLRPRLPGSVFHGLRLHSRRGRRGHAGARRAGRRHVTRDRWPTAGRAGRRAR